MPVWVTGERGTTIMRRQAIDIARVGRLRALKWLRDRPLTECPTRPTSVRALQGVKSPREDTLTRLLAYYDNVVCLPNAEKRHKLVFGIR